ncbi:alcohol dehydrogenase catalytic domain-containing protein [Actinoplanes sp. TBRC 11911]|uniref:alcohol dehydrogenase catalytic domain-containing protein n=1 Tax=Actinoplanes sp. TBRC 11911 TaxID=2729386 RepID=UPI00145F3C9F|nr:alcohol dehydrogenase catalytic domain-containing protein [Actinoplanes sp. TBRC 11911]NMO55897.1 alcohol dehydrogenase catalytic domain-containing protein [Actinoplanes sp. TBRC 11911]
MLTAVANAPGEPLVFTERDVPEPGPGEVLVKITACGVCYTDLDVLQGHWPMARFPVVPGHEITGVVVTAGPGASWQEVGSAVGAQILGDSCRHCDYCARGDQILCPQKRFTGIVMDGGYAEYAVLKADFVTRLPEGLDPVAAAPLMCAGLTAFNALRRAGITPTSRVAIIGAGALGMLAIRYAVAMGARVAVVGRSDRELAAGKEAGAERFISTADSDPAEALKAWNGGADLILNASPSTSAAAAAFTGLAPDGTLVLCGYGADPLILPTEPMALNRLHAMINPSGSPHDARDTLAFSAAHGILPEFTPIALRDAGTVLDAMARGQAGRRSIIVFD